MVLSTVRHNQGCRVHAILVPIVSDMLVTWQAGVFASTTATYICICCSLKIQDIENLDRSTWPKQDAVEHIQLVRHWWEAETLEEQEHIFRSNSIQWSPLLNLPYWNPILFTAIEPMHVFNVGLFQTHCRQVWGINVSAPGGDGTATMAAMLVPRPPNSDFEKWYDIIHSTQDSESLCGRLNGRGCPCDILWHICSDHNLHHAGNKQQLIWSIDEWVSVQCLFMLRWNQISVTVSVSIIRHDQTTKYLLWETTTFYCFYDPFEPSSQCQRYRISKHRWGEHWHRWLSAL